MRRWLPLILVVAALACGDDGPVRPSGPPVFLSVTLVPDAPLVDTVLVEVACEGADLVSLRVDGAWAATDETPPFLIQWDSQSVADGSHQLTLQARNSAGTVDSTLTRIVANLTGGVAVAVTPATTMLMAGQQLRFAAVVQGTDNPGVDWRVDPAEGAVLPGGPGSVDPTGLYTAPDPAPSGEAVVVRATSRADASRSATALVTFIDTITVVIVDTPSSVRLARTYQLDARLYGSSYDQVSWKVLEGALHGSVDTAGVYTAPSTMPSPPQVTFVARGRYYPQFADTADAVPILGTITIVFTRLPSLAYIGRSYTVRARVYDSSDGRIRYSIDEGPAHGSIDENGIYTAPTTLPQPPQATIRATSLADTLATVSRTIPIQSPVGISLVSPPSEVFLNQTLAFEAAVTGTTDTRVGWSVDEGPAHGTIDENGLYTAPASRPVPSEATIRATSLADPATSASHRIPIWSTVEISIAQSPPWVLLNHTGTFVAAVTGTTDTRVGWRVDEGPVHGTIDGNGVYTAPAGLPDPPRATIRAISLADTLETAAVEVSLYGPVTIHVLPESVEVGLSHQMRFTAVVENSPSEEVVWEVGGGAQYGSVTADGLYTAPASLPEPSGTVVRARSAVDPSARDSAWVELVEVPPPAEMDLLREMYHANYEATVLAEQVTGIAATALGIARYLTGDETVRSGRIYEDETGWHYEATTGGVMEISPLEGPETLIDYAVADGQSFEPYGGLSYRRGSAFHGELDCTIQVGPDSPGLHLTNSSRWRDGTPPPWWSRDIKTSFERTLNGTISNAGGGAWQLDLSLNGDMWVAYDPFKAALSSTGVLQALSGSITTPTGLTVAVEDSFSLVLNHDVYSHRQEALRTQSFEGHISATLSPGLYRWHDLSFYYSWLYDDPRNISDWHSRGAVLRDGQGIGTVGFDRPVSPDMTARARPWADFGANTVIYLDTYVFGFDDPSRPAASPFRW